MAKISISKPFIRFPVCYLRYNMHGKTTASRQKPIKAPGYALRRTFRKIPGEIVP